MISPKDMMMEKLQTLLPILWIMHSGMFRCSYHPLWQPRKRRNVVGVEVVEEPTKKNKDTLNDCWDLTISELEQEELQMDPEVIYSKRRKNVLSRFSKIFRDTKARIKSEHLICHETHEDRVNDIPEVLYKDDWEELVNYWESEEVKLDAKIHQDIRAEQKIKHTSGRTSFGRSRSEFAKENNGQQPFGGEFFVIKHTSKRRNAPLDEESRRIIVPMKISRT